jgi:integrase/recombinase XerD
MTDLHAVVDDYLSLRRALGYKLQGRDRLLHGFVDFLDQAGEPTVTTESALAWATLPPGGERVWWSQRLGFVRGFARHLHAIDPATEIPSADLLPGRKCRATPYLYSDADMAALMTQARALRHPLLAAGYETLFGLLATTGMRVGEAIALDRGDIDAGNEVLVIRQTKFRKSREVPLHATTIEKLTAYAEVRDQLCPHPKTAALFVSTRGTRFIYNDVHHTFRRLASRAGLEPRSACCRPRLHDMRH